MKQIIEKCNSTYKYGKVDDVKLRLRGKGSNFKEGPKQEESEEPLHLCISSSRKDKFDVACEHAEHLISNIYS